MEPAEWVLVLMLVGHFEHGRITERVEEIVPTHKCEEVRQAAESYNNRLRWLWEEDDREIQVMCLEHPGNRSA